jgi:hypothetical protein
MKYYRLLAMVPPLPEAPESPPLPLETLVELLYQDMAEADRPLAASLLGFLDCRNLEALLQGHDVFDERAPLSRVALEEKQDLPEYLAEFLAAHESGSISDEYPFDALWRAYFTHLVETADLARSTFLREWAGYEISLRDALARQRAEALGEKGDMRVSGVPSDDGENHAALLSTLAEASNPMERERLLDTARLAKIESIAGIDPFSTDAALSYLAAILILDRWDVGKAADVAKMLEVFA